MLCTEVPKVLNRQEAPICQSTESSTTLAQDHGCLQSLDWTSGLAGLVDWTGGPALKTFLWFLTSLYGCMMHYKTCNFLYMYGMIGCQANIFFNDNSQCITWAYRLAV